MIDVSIRDFEESTVKSFERVDNDIIIIVKTEKNVSKLLQLVFKNVIRFEIDEVFLPRKLMAAEDGELIFLTLFDHKAVFGIDWNNYSEGKFFNYEYRIEFETYSITFLGLVTN